MVDFLTELDNQKSSALKIDFCISSLVGANSELKNLIFEKIVDLGLSNLSGDKMFPEYFGDEVESYLLDSNFHNVESLAHR